MWESPRVEGKAGQKGLEQVTSRRPDEAVVTSASTRQDVAKDSLVTEGVSRPPISTNRTQKRI